MLEPGGLTAASLLGIRRLGARLSIDDFGTGYSSLTALMELRVNGFKIDRSFISNVITNPTNATITGTLIVMAKGLGLELIAEGVETVDQMQHLYSQGCAYMQGYLLGKPVSAEEFEAQLDSPNAPWREATAGLVELE